MPLKDKDQQRAFNKAYRATHRKPRIRDRKAYNKAYYAAHREKQLAEKAALYWADPEKHKSKCRAWVDANRTRVNEYNRAYRAKDQEKSRRQMREWKVAHKDKVSEYAATYHVRHRDAVAAKTKAWNAANPGKRKAAKANRRACELRQTPAWADLNAIQAFYTACPPGYHVDHIVPLQGKTVSGLHVLNNLQYLLPVENARKGARLMDLAA